jgi:hypothetical protein
MGRCIAGLEAGEELVLDDTRISVVDGSDKELIVRAAGQNRTFRIEAVPTVLLILLGERHFRNDAESKASFAAFLAVDPKGDRALARTLIEEAATAGVAVDELRAVLDDTEGDRD